LKFLDPLPQGVREIPHCWIPLSTGERLAARIWLPEEADEAPVPAIVEYIPYRRRDYSAVRDHGTHSYLAAHGYACLRIDVRGAGDSDGIHGEQWADDYDRDALDAFKWIADQPWCDGAIGMIGLSWGGQTCLKMASLAPPELKAVAPCSAADDRYTNKYLGGCLLLNSVVWSTTMVAQNSRPPDPATAGEGWRETWLGRLEGAARYIENWVGHQRRDDYWRSGSVTQHMGGFGCPVYIFGGAADPGYADTVPRLVERLTVSAKGVIGPWAHKFPHWPAPGPGIGYLDEVLRWFDRWLKDEENGTENMPALSAWMHDYAEPQGYMKERPGRWVAEPVWPSPDIAPRVFHLNPAGLGTEPGEETAIEIASPQSVGLAAGEWMPWIAFGEEPELPLEQSPDDERSVTFETEPLVDRLEILGNPMATLELVADRPVANIVVRLCDVAPDGTSMRVAYGALNLTRRGGLEDPQPLTPGERIRVEVPLYVAAHSFPEGHRIRVAISTAYWPVIWPAPEAAIVTLYTVASSIALPVRPPRLEDGASAFTEPSSAPLMERAQLEPPMIERTTSHDAATGEAVLHQLDDAGLFRLEAHDLNCGARTERWLRIRDDDPTTARADMHWTWRLERGDWRIRTEVAGAVWCTASTFETETRIEAFEGDDRVFERTWTKSIPRDLL
jgi:hypothetical protein